MPKKLKYEDVKQIFEENGCVLLSVEYKNSKTPLDYVCDCGNTSKITITDFKNGVRCKKCAIGKIKNKLKFDFDYVNNYYKECGCDLLEHEYNTVHEKMRFKCHCGNIEEGFTFKQFKGYKQCRDCCGIIYYNLENVKSIFRESECILLATEYIDNSQEVEYICSCGNKEKNTIQNYINSSIRKCKACVYKITGGKRSLNIDHVRQFFQQNNCVLLSTEYINNTKSLDYICSCGNKDKVTFNSFQMGVRCHGCMGKRISEKVRKDILEVRDYFNEYDCTLLTENYENQNQLLIYKCKCGREDEKSFIQFQSCPKCPQCKSDYLSSIRKGQEFPNRRGENHPQWNFDLTPEEREKGRFLTEYKLWRKQVYERDDYTCQCCGDNKGGNLNAHHLDSYDWNKIDRFNVDNGVTLCNLCHKDFHALYGYGDNTKEQFEEYILELTKTT